MTVQLGEEKVDTAEARGYRSSDVPLSFSKRLRDDDPVFRAVMNGVAPVQPAVSEMTSAILANFRVGPRATFFYSRDRSHYSRRAVRRYYPNYYTYVAVVTAVDLLSHSRFVEDIRTAPSPRATTRSRLRATPALLELLGICHTVPIVYCENESIVLRRSGKSKEQIDYVDTEQTRLMRADVQAQNEFLRPIKIGLEGVAGVVVEVEGQRYDLSAKLLYRVFNGDFEHGGRWYGPAWQSLPGEIRKRLTINGSATVEEDFSACHVQLLCAAAGVVLPFHDSAYDFYRLNGFERKEVKYAVQILLNACSRRSARGALTEKLEEIGVPDAALRAKALCKAIPAAWPQLARYWFTGIGLRLQRIDGDVCARVQADMRAHGIPVLSVHDSFIVPVAARRSLQLSMSRAMKDACAQLRSRAFAIEVKECA